MRKLLDKTYLIRGADLVSMLHHALAEGCVTGILHLSENDPPYLPIGESEEASEWILEKLNDLKLMRKRKDGTSYMPQRKEA